jgi:uncharacterized membrane protein (UPF0127 family)
MLQGAGYKRGELRDAASGQVLLHELIIARSRKSRKKGLLALDGLPDGTGLLIGEPLVHMVGMRFALDLVFISRSRRVIKVCENVRPGWKIRGSLRAGFCLELANGQAQAAGLRPGVTVAFP